MLSACSSSGAWRSASDQERQAWASCFSTQSALHLVRGFASPIGNNMLLSRICAHLAERQALLLRGGAQREALLHGQAPPRQPHVCKQAHCWFSTRVPCQQNESASCASSHAQPGCLCSTSLQAKVAHHPTLHRRPGALPTAPPCSSSTVAASTAARWSHGVIAEDNCDTCSRLQLACCLVLSQRPRKTSGRLYRQATCSWLGDGMMTLQRGRSGSIAHRGAARSRREVGQGVQEGALADARRRAAGQGAPAAGLRRR